MLFVLLTTCAFAPMPDAEAKELVSLEGKWAVMQVDQDGMPGKYGLSSKSYFIFKNDLLIFKNEDANNSVSYRIKIVRPGLIDFFPNDKPLKGQRLEGIYKIEGDKLTMCRTMCQPFEDDPEITVRRPTEFKTKENDSFKLFVLKRVKE